MRARGVLPETVKKKHKEAFENKEPPHLLRLMTCVTTPPPPPRLPTVSHSPSASLPAAAAAFAPAAESCSTAAAAASCPLSSATLMAARISSSAAASSHDMYSCASSCLRESMMHAVTCDHHISLQRLPALALVARHVVVRAEHRQRRDQVLRRQNVTIKHCGLRMAEGPRG